MHPIGRRDYRSSMNKMPPTLYALYRQGIAVRRALAALSNQERLQALMWANAWCLLTQLSLDKESWNARLLFGAPPPRLH